MKNINLAVIALVCLISCNIIKKDENEIRKITHDLVDEGFDEMDEEPIP